MGAGGDVEKDHFIGALLVVTDSQRDGIADVAQLAGFSLAELDAAGDVAVVNVKTWDYALCEHTNDMYRTASRQTGTKETQPRISRMTRIGKLLLPNREIREIRDEKFFRLPGVPDATSSSFFRIALDKGQCPVYQA
jgi:hypothetical protein